MLYSCYIKWNIGSTWPMMHVYAYKQLQRRRKESSHMSLIRSSTFDFDLE